MRRILCGHNLNLQLRMRLLRCCVFSILLYRVESWTLTEATMKRKTMKMWIYRHMLRISWMDRVTNKAVLDRMRKKGKLERIIKTRKLSYFGYVMRHPETYSLLHLIIQGKIRKARPRQKKNIVAKESASMVWAIHRFTV